VEFKQICPRCQQRLPTTAVRCLVCGWRQEVGPVTPTAHLEQIERYSSIGLATVIILVCTVLILSAPGIGILFSVLTLPPLVRTVLVLRKRQQRALPTTRMSTLLMFIGSVGFLTAVIATCISIAVVTGIISFFLACTFMPGNNQQVLMNSWMWLTTVGIAAFLVLAGFLLRARWRWDTQPDYRPPPPFPKGFPDDQQS
jgi:hypothetical protein